MAEARKKTNKEKAFDWSKVIAIILLLANGIYDRFIERNPTSNTKVMEVVVENDARIKELEKTAVSLDKRMSILETENTGTKSMIIDIQIFQRDLNNYLRQNK